MKTQSTPRLLAVHALGAVCLLGAHAVLGFTPLSAQAVPTLQFMASTPLRGLPDDIHLGEVAGVARSGNGQTIYVYTRTGNPTISLGTSRAVSHGGSRLLVFDGSGN